LAENSYFSQNPYERFTEPKLMSQARTEVSTLTLLEELRYDEAEADVSSEN
jgi:hypothetical protein